jgi:hypothetical protein
LRALALEVSRGFARDCRRAFGGRKRLQTPRRLEPVFGVAPRFSRIDTLKCRKAVARGVFGRREPRRSKHMRGGRKPNGWIGRPRRGKRSREHRLERTSNRERPSTDSRSEQGSEVEGTRLSAAAPTGLSQTRMRRCGRSVLTPRRRSRPLAGYPAHLGGPSIQLMPGFIVRVARANTAFDVRRVGGRKGATTERGEGRARGDSSKVRAGQDGKRAKGTERCHGWPRGKSSGGRNPMGGCGAKQSHEARAGSNR